MAFVLEHGGFCPSFFLNMIFFAWDVPFLVYPFFNLG